MTGLERHILWSSIRMKTKGVINHLQTGLKPHSIRGNLGLATLSGQELVDSGHVPQARNYCCCSEK